MQPVWQAQAAAPTGTGVTTGGGQQRKGPHGQAGQGAQGWVHVLSGSMRGTSIPGRASGRGPQDLCVPGMSIREGPPGPPQPRDGHPGRAHRISTPPGWSSGRDPQDHRAPRDRHLGGTPRTAAPLGRASGRAPQDHHDPGEAGSCPGGCLCPPAQALVLTQLLCSSS